MAAVLRKEMLVEARGRHGLFTSLLFSLMAVTVIGLAASRATPSPSIAAGMLWVAILFAAITGLGRTFMLEEEQGTGDLLRLWARPGPVFWGKLLYNLAFLMVVATFVTALYLLFVDVVVGDYLLLGAAMVSGSMALAAGISVCGALVARAQSRGALLGVISIPPLLIVVVLGAVAIGVAFGEPGNGWPGVLGLLGISLAFWSLGPYLFASVWKQ